MMTDFYMPGIPRSIAEQPDMATVERIRESIGEDNGQMLRSSMLLPCPFCGRCRSCRRTSWWTTALTPAWCALAATWRHLPSTCRGARRTCQRARTSRACLR